MMTFLHTVNEYLLIYCRSFIISKLEKLLLLRRIYYTTLLDKSTYIGQHKMDDNFF